MLMAGVVLLLNSTARNAVMVVPTLAPMIKGAACLKVTSFLATIGTTTEVVIVLDRMAAVVATPQNRDLSRFVKKNLLKASGDLALSMSEMIFRNNNTDPKINRNESAIKTKPLFTK